MQELHTPTCRVHNPTITCAAPWLPQGQCQRSGSCHTRVWPMLMILADSRKGARVMHSWCGSSPWTTRQQWQAGAQFSPASLKDYPTCSEMPLRGRDLVPPVHFVENFMVAPSADSAEIFPINPSAIQWLQLSRNHWLWNLFPAATLCSIN